MADIFGTSAGDSLTGTSGADRIEGLAGNDVLKGEGGDDVLLGGEDGDNIEGGTGNDRLEGGAGADYLLGGAGDDTILAGEGDDTVYSSEGSDIIDVGSGNNYITLFYSSLPTSNVQLTAGDGRDYVRLVSYGASSFTMNLGGGNDEISIELLGADGVAGGSALLTLGAGRDSISLGYLYPGSAASPGLGVVTVTDFETGISGDTVNFLEALTRGLTNWNTALNPFSTGAGSGHLRLVQQGADSVLQIDRDGGANAFTTFMVFKNRLVSDFTPNNLDGFPIDGTIPSGLSVVGTGDSDILVGWAGDDSLSGAGLQDFLYGGAGNDRLDGGDGSDQLLGEVGDDLLNGGNDGDNLDGGLGNDILNGDDGNDYLQSYEGNDTLDGGAGNDNFRFYDVSGGTARGGVGDDSIFVKSYSSAGQFSIDGGDGADRIEFWIFGGRADVTLGAGADVLVLSDGAPGLLLSSGRIVISDFAAGPGGDSVEMKLLLTALSGGWNGSDNPFGSGHARLVQSGADTLLQIDADGGGNSWQTAVTFTGRNVADFTSANFEGYPPDGSAPAGVTLTGTAASDKLTGGAGADTIDGLDGDDQLVGGAGGDTIRGGDGNDLLQGDGGNDVLEGGLGNDRLEDGAGNDLSQGGDGNDTLSSNYGNDELSGGAGDDSLNVYRANPRSEIVTISGGAGNDSADLTLYSSSLYRVDMGVGDDRIVINASTGSIEMTLGAGADIVSLPGVHLTGSHNLSILDFVAGPGGDRLALDSLFGSALVGWNAADNPFTTGFARLYKNGSDMLLQVDRDGTATGDGYRTLVTLKNVGPTGFTADNFGWVPTVITGETRVGTAGNDTLVTGDGDDSLDGGGGADTMYGGRGNDLYFVDNMGDSIREFTGEGIDEIRTSLAVYSLAALPNVENLSASSSIAHDFIGNASSNVLTGGGGDDVLRSSAGLDRTVGGQGNDTHYVDDSGDVVVELAGEGADTVVVSVDYVLSANVENLQSANIGGGDPLRLTGNALNNYIWGTQGNNVIDGAGGADFMIGYAGDDFYQVDNVGDIAYELAGGGADTVATSISYILAANVENLQAVNIGGTDPLALTGNAQNNHIWATQGNNVIDGGAGADFMIGYGGDDFYFVDNMGDIAYELEGGGLDTVATLASYVLAANVENLQSLNIGGTDALALTGNGLNNYIWATQGNNIIDGGGGADVMIGYGGDDFYYVDNMSDVTVEEAGGGSDTVAATADYKLNANIENLQAAVIGGNAALNLTGNDLNNYIWGTQGNNILAGGGGIDRLFGYAGADQFLFNTAAGANDLDILADFQAGTDKIALDNAVFTALSDGALPSSAFVAGTAALDADDRILFNAADGSVFYDADGNGAGAAVLIAYVPVGQALTAADFTVV